MSQSLCDGRLCRDPIPHLLVRIRASHCYSHPRLSTTIFFLSNHSDNTLSFRKMKILVVGSGGREHALVWKLSMSPMVDHIYVAPGNGGTATMSNVTNITDVLSTDYDGLVAKSKELGISLVVVGPDDAVVVGIEEYFRGSEFSIPSVPST